MTAVSISSSLMCSEWGITKLYGPDKLIYAVYTELGLQVTAFTNKGNWPLKVAHESIPKPVCGIRHP